MSLNYTKALLLNGELFEMSWKNAPTKKGLLKLNR
jgi:hypothetical protein